jgi:hypothetical protein
MHLGAILVQHRLSATTVFKAVEVNVYPGLVQSLDFVKQVENTPIIHWVGYIQAYYM